MFYQPTLCISTTKRKADRLPALTKVLIAICLLMFFGHLLGGF